MWLLVQPVAGLLWLVAPLLLLGGVGSTELFFT